MRKREGGRDFHYSICVIIPITIWISHQWLGSGDIQQFVSYSLTVMAVLLH